MAVTAPLTCSNLSVHYYYCCLCWDRLWLDLSLASTTRSLLSALFYSTWVNF